MSHYDDLTDEQRIKLARDAVKYGVPIAPRIALWLQDQGIYDQITNPRKLSDDTNKDASGTDADSDPGGSG